MMKQKTIGFWLPDSIIFSQRDGRQNYTGRDLPYTGLRTIVRNIKNMKVVPVYGFDIPEEIDILLCSMISFYDVLNLAHIDRKNAKIIVGGPACNNIRGYIEHIDGAFFGRCDDPAIIQKICHLEKHPAFWIKTKDPEFIDDYIVQSSHKKFLSEKQIHLFDAFENIQKSIGCPVRCKFCLYSHWNKYITIGNMQNYKSGVSAYEDFFSHLEWDKCKRGGVTALDGANEATRYQVGKRISYPDIVKKILSINKSGYRGWHRVKCYNIYGYPWETSAEEYNIDLIEAAKECDDKINRKLSIVLHNSHFIPFVKTPMGKEKFNFDCFHTIVKNNLFLGKNIRIFPGTHNQSPRLSLLSTIIQRARAQLPKTFFSKTIWKMNYNKLKEYALSLDIDLWEIDYDVIANVKTHEKEM